ncbi:MAG: hypothetical protein G01um10145_902 [Microgenomates group bacterium Gr01-1014_5]|nr:MAG: hypothetical protein G01um10145_902 [Microgenomates group bacterium Gr01-1014_5]
MLEPEIDRPLPSRIEDQPIPDIKITPEQKAVLNKTLEWVQDFFDVAIENDQVIMGGHGFDHNIRVSGMAGVLSTKEGVDPFLPILTSLLIDIGRTNRDPRAHNFKHGELSREMAEDFINSLPLTSDQRELVKNAIEDHPKLNEQSQMKEEVCLLRLLWIPIGLTVWVRWVQYVQVRLDGVYPYSKVKLALLARKEQV